MVMQRGEGLPGCAGDLPYLLPAVALQGRIMLGIEAAANGALFRDECSGCLSRRAEPARHEFVTGKGACSMRRVPARMMRWYHSAAMHLQIRRTVGGNDGPQRIDRCAGVRRVGCRGIYEAKL